MILKRLLASLIAVALIAGLPGGGYAACAAGADCAMVSSVNADEGCCGGTDMPSCAIACGLHMAAVGDAADRLAAAADPAPRAGADTHARLLAGPPDTAPPKSISA